MYMKYDEPEMIKDVFKSVEDEDVENIRFYISDGADPDMKGKDGHTLLIHAMIHKKWHAAETLLEMGADPDLVVGVTGQSALHYAAGDDSAHMIGVLAAHKAKIDLADSLGITPLHMAAYKGNIEAAEALIERGADLTAKDGNAARPIDAARQRMNDTLKQVSERAARMAEYLREKMNEQGVEFMTKEQRATALAQEIAALKSRNPDRYKLNP